MASISTAIGIAVGRGIHIQILLLIRRGEKPTTARAIRQLDNLFFLNASAVMGETAFRFRFFIIAGHQVAAVSTWQFKHDNVSAAPRFPPQHRLERLLIAHSS